MNSENNINELREEIRMLRAQVEEARKDLTREVDLNDVLTAQRVPVDDDEVRGFVLMALARRTLLNSDERQDCADQILTAFAPAKYTADLLREAADSVHASLAEDGISDDRKAYRKGLETRLRAAIDSARSAAKEAT